MQNQNSVYLHFEDAFCKSVFVNEVCGAQGHGTPDRIDALVTILGGAAMLGWLMCAAPFFVSLQTGVFR